MRKILDKIFGSKQSTGQLLFAGFGFLLGLLLLLLSVQLYIQIQRLLNPAKAYSEYIILSKKINLSNTLMLNRAEFGKNEIEELKKQEFIQDVGLFISNQFEVLAYARGRVPFMSELFFESVPDSLLDIIPENWGWKEDSDFIPVILSQDILNLYNFGYALGKGLPQLSAATVNMVTIQIRISGPQGERNFKGKVVGFSERIPSILVPQKFMIWANTHIGTAKEVPPSRLIVKVNNPSDHRMADFFKRKNYQINEDRLSASKAGSIVNIVMSIIGLIGAFFIALSFVVFSMNFRVILAEAKEEIKLLIQLGYTTRMLGLYLIGYFLLFIGLILSTTFVLLYYSIQILQKFMMDSGLNVEGGIEPVVWLTALIFVLLTVFINIFFVARLLKKYA